MLLVGASFTSGCESLFVVEVCMLLDAVQFVIFVYNLPYRIMYAQMLHYFGSMVRAIIEFAEK